MLFVTFARGKHKDCQLPYEWILSLCMKIWIFHYSQNQFVVWEREIPSADFQKEFVYICDMYVLYYNLLVTYWWYPQPVSWNQELCDFCTFSAVEAWYEADFLLVSGNGDTVNKNSIRIYSFKKMLHCMKNSFIIDQMEFSNLMHYIELR